MNTLEKSLEAAYAELLKAGKRGEGSRGGKVIGHTKSGKPVYEKREYKSFYQNWSGRDHRDAFRLHKKFSDKYDREADKKYPDRDRIYDDSRESDLAYHHRMMMMFHEDGERQSKEGREKQKQKEAKLKKEIEEQEAKFTALLNSHKVPPEHPEASKLTKDTKGRKGFKKEAFFITKTPKHPRDLDNPKLFVSDRPATSRVVDEMFRNNVEPDQPNKIYEQYVRYGRYWIAKMPIEVEKMARKLSRKDMESLALMIQAPKNLGKSGRTLLRALNRIWELG